MLGVLRQTAIYRAGVSGRRPRVPTDATQLEARAKKAMPSEAFAYIAGGLAAIKYSDSNTPAEQPAAPEASEEAAA